MAQIIYTFPTEKSKEETTSIIQNAIIELGGKIKQKEFCFSGKWYSAWKASFNPAFSFYVGDDIVRAVSDCYDSDIWSESEWARVKTCDKIWAMLCEKLRADFDVSPDTPQIEAVLYADKGMSRIVTSEGCNNPSYGKAVIGGLLFGLPGAIIGGLSGKTKTISTEKTVSPDRVFVKARYTNGRIKEGYIMKNSELYNWFAVNYLTK